MRLNSSIQLISEKIMLVPYRIEHVPKYHKWMEDDELREQTASERLTLQEEYDMQQTWLRDDNKCTFIALDKNTMLKTGSEIESMIGDANLYLSNTEAGDISAEVGLMVAEPAFRGKGLGKEIAFCLLRYGISALKILRFQAVISLKNEISIKMFEKLTFNKESTSDVFQEATLTRTVDEEFEELVKTSTPFFKEADTFPNK